MLWRREVKERLTRNIESLASYCQLPDITADHVSDDPITEHLKKLVRWPSRELLREIEDNVLDLALLERNKPILPIWRAFEQVDKRMKKLRLKSRVSDLIRRACAILAGESVLSKAARERNTKETLLLLCDIELRKRNLAELLEDDRRRVRQKWMAGPLVEWAVNIGHPMAKDLDGVTAFLFGWSNEAVEEVKLLQQREKIRERVRRHRLRKKNASG
jgi:hypothetical protein